LFPHCPYDRFRPRYIAYIANATMHSPADGANISDRPIEIGIAASANKYASSLARIRSGDRLADSTATAGDERDFPGQLLLSLTCHFANAIT
jgi:hypothetical protein